jgi:hypothetical protein
MDATIKINGNRITITTAGDAKETVELIRGLMKLKGAETSHPAEDIEIIEEAPPKHEAKNTVGEEYSIFYESGTTEPAEPVGKRSKLGEDLQQILIEGDPLYKPTDLTKYLDDRGYTDSQQKQIRSYMNSKGMSEKQMMEALKNEGTGN